MIFEFMKFIGDCMLVITGFAIAWWLLVFLYYLIIGMITGLAGTIEAALITHETRRKIKNEAKKSDK